MSPRRGSVAETPAGSGACLRQPSNKEAVLDVVNNLVKRGSLRELNRAMSKACDESFTGTNPKCRIEEKPGRLFGCRKMEERIRLNESQHGIPSAAYRGNPGALDGDDKSDEALVSGGLCGCRGEKLDGVPQGEIAKNSIITSTGSQRPDSGEALNCSIVDSAEFEEVKKKKMTFGQLKKKAYELEEAFGSDILSFGTCNVVTKTSRSEAKEALAATNDPRDQDRQPESVKSTEMVMDENIKMSDVDSFSCPNTGMRGSAVFKPEYSRQISGAEVNVYQSPAGYYLITDNTRGNTYRRQTENKVVFLGAKNGALFQRFEKLWLNDRLNEPDDELRSIALLDIVDNNNVKRRTLKADDLSGRSYFKADPKCVEGVRNSLLWGSDPDSAI